MKRSESPVAAWRHSAGVGAVMLGVAVAGWLTTRDGGAAPPSGGSNAGLYLGLIAAELGLFAYVRAGVRGAGIGLARLVSARPLDARAIAIDLVVAALLLAGWLLMEQEIGRLLGHGDQAAVARIVVHRRADIPLWILLALTAGCVEEFVFRGYVQRQIASVAGTAAGVVGQALLFGAVHSYQGAVLVATVTLFGLLFGVVAAERRSLVPGMIAHAAVDLIGGLGQLG